VTQGKSLGRVQPQPLDSQSTLEVRATFERSARLAFHVNQPYSPICMLCTVDFRMCVACMVGGLVQEVDLLFRSPGGLPRADLADICFILARRSLCGVVWITR
jgi:hypothetical protein